MNHLDQLGAMLRHARIEYEGEVTAAHDRRVQSPTGKRRGITEHVPEKKTLTVGDGDSVVTFHFNDKNELQSVEGWSF